MVDLGWLRPWPMPGCMVHLHTAKVATILEPQNTAGIPPPDRGCNETPLQPARQPSGPANGGLGGGQLGGTCNCPNRIIRESYVTADRRPVSSAQLQPHPTDPGTRPSLVGRALFASAAAPEHQLTCTMRHALPGPCGPSNYQSELRLDAVCLSQRSYSRQANCTTVATSCY